MTVKDIKQPQIKITFNEKEWNVKFALRNFALLFDRYGISEDQLLKGMVNGDRKMLVFAIWCSSVKFKEPFNPLEPTAVEEEINLEDLFDMDLATLKSISDEVIKAMEAFLPKQPEGVKKQQAKKHNQKSLK